MKKALLLSAFIPTYAWAGVQPPDVPAYVAQPVTYAAGASTPNVLGDGSNAYGGTPPAMSSELADIPTTQTGWTWNGTNYTDTSAPFSEAKFRTHANVCYVLADDAIRAYGAPGTSHLHEFFGNCGANAYSTYARLRKDAKLSLAAGGPLNGTGYWFPAPIIKNAFGDGKDYAVKADYVIIYYSAGSAADAQTRVNLARGQRYVLGINMDDPDDNGVKAEVAAANAQPGTAGRYSYIYAGFNGWYCYNASGVQVGPTAGSLVNADGSDPFGGLCTGGPGWTLYASANAPDCWDGVNLASPDGYKHMRQQIRDNYLGGTVCPMHWYKQPQLQIKVAFSITSAGFNDYKRWRLSSDDMAATVSGHSVPNGGSFHTDWLGGWDGATFTTWQSFCTGVNGNVSHQCDDSTISSTTSLIRGEVAPTGRNPQVDLSQQYTTDNPSNMFLVPAAPNGPATIHAHGN